MQNEFGHLFRKLTNAEMLLLIAQQKKSNFKKVKKNELTWLSSRSIWIFIAFAANHVRHLFSCLTLLLQQFSSIKSLHLFDHPIFRSINTTFDRPGSVRHDHNSETETELIFHILTNSGHNYHHNHHHHKTFPLMWPPSCFFFVFTFYLAVNPVRVPLSTWLHFVEWPFTCVRQGRSFCNASIFWCSIYRPQTHAHPRFLLHFSFIFCYSSVQNHSLSLFFACSSMLFLLHSLFLAIATYRLNFFCNISIAFSVILNPIRLFSFFFFILFVFNVIRFVATAVRFK